MARPAGDAEDGEVRKRVRCAVVAGAAGLGIWMATMGAVPDGEYASSARTTLLWAAMIVAAGALGYALPGDSDLIALGLAGGPLLIAGWTAPRGDGDGLWVLFFPYLVFMGFVLALVAWLTGRLRIWLAATARDR
jgi:hypothetical protein